MGGVRPPFVPGYSGVMAYGWHDSLGPGGPSFDFQKLEEARRQRPLRSRWLGAAAAGFLAALGAAVLATQSLTEAHWVLLAGGGLWLLAAGVHYLRRALRRRRRTDPPDATTRPSAASKWPSWWLQPMSRRQATILGLPLIASTVLEVITDSDYVAFAWVMFAGEGSGVIYLVLDYLRSQHLERVRRFRVEEDDSRRKWRRYRWPHGARTLR